MCEVAQSQVAPFLHEVRFVLSRFVLRTSCAFFVFVSVQSSCLNPRIRTNHTAQCTIGPEDDRPTGQLTNGSIVRLCGER